MSEKPISDLRRRMLEDMAVRKFGEKTSHDYIRHFESLAKFLGRSPDTTAVDVRRFQVHLTERGVQRGDLLLRAHRTDDVKRPAMLTLRIASSADVTDRRGCGRGGVTITRSAVHRPGR